uniref:Uncharacterized protein n=1 Tax=Pelusios castaneus TaxID=367368 RepID=A0A8C8VH51_9SAUR
MSDSTRMSAVNSDLSSNLEERMQSPQNLQSQQDGKPFNNNTSNKVHWVCETSLSLRERV